MKDLAVVAKPARAPALRVFDAGPILDRHALGVVLAPLRTAQVAGNPHAIRGIAVEATRARVLTDGHPQVVIIRPAGRIAAEAGRYLLKRPESPAVTGLVLHAPFDPNLVAVVDSILVDVIERV